MSFVCRRVRFVLSSKYLNFKTQQIFLKQQRNQLDSQRQHYSYNKLMERSKDTIILFDVDGTLTKSRNEIEQDMIDILTQLKERYYVGVVGGSDLNKINEQLTKTDYCFSENGLYALKKGEFFAKRSLSEELGEEKLKKFINTTLHLLADIEIPLKRGTFIEYRTGMLNISPIGRNCSQSERDDFEKYDHEHKVREQMIEKLKAAFPNYNLKYSIGGQISFDVFPEGWDKTYCLRYLENEFKTIHFYGDKTFPGGNDYEIFSSDRTIGHSVKNPQETIASLKELFLK